MTPVLSENVENILSRLVAAQNPESGTASHHTITLIRQWLLSVCAVSPYIERCCLQFDDLLPRLCEVDALSSEFPAPSVDSLRIELESDLDKQWHGKESAVLDSKAIESLQQSVLRRFRHRQLVAILLRDLIGVCSLEQTLQALSALAECCVGAADQWVHDALVKRFGTPCDAQGREQRLIVLGMGKLGGHELNVSSDIDLVCVFPEAGSTRVDESAQRSLDNSEFFRRSVQGMTRLLHSVTEDGFVYRVDTRLRPFGESGPLVTNFEALEHYFLTQGRDWERYAMIKSRALSGHVQDIQALEELITPFVYRRYLDYNAFEALRVLKKKIALSVARKGMSNNIKLGEGGIREIEFVGQAFQLVRGGRDSRLRIRPIIQVLWQLALQELIPQKEVEQLLAAYRYLRIVENAIQMIRDEQRHELPEDEHDRARLLAIVDAPDWPSFIQVLGMHQAHVSNCFKHLFESSEQSVASSQSLPDNSLDRLAPSVDTPDAAHDQWLSLTAESIDTEEQRSRLRLAGFDPVEPLLSAIDSVSRGVYFHRLTAESQQRIERIAPMILNLAGKTSDPTAALTRSLALVRAVAGRSGYLQVLSDQPAALERLVTLFANSRWLAHFVVNQPMVIDELLTSDGKSFSADAVDLQEETKALVSRLLDAELDEQMDTLRHFRQAREMRIACAQIDGTLSLMQVSDQLSWLAEALIAAVIKLVESRLQQKHGKPYCEDGETGERRKTQLAVVAYGKLGGYELGFASDLDLVFLHDSRNTRQVTDGEKSIDNALYYGRLTQKFVHFMNTTTPAGVLYDIDLRLRPNGNSGVLVTGIDAFQKYQHDEAWTWEHQALIRARLVYGSPTMHQTFDSIRQAVLAQARSAEQLRKAVASMRERMRKALGNSDPDQMHLKQDAGGVADIEFIVQYLVLAHASRYPQLLQYTDNVRVLETAQKLGLLASSDCHQLTESYLMLRKRLHQQVLQELPSTVPIDEDLTVLRDAVVKIRSRILADG